MNEPQAEPVDIQAPSDWRDSLPEDIRAGVGDVNTIEDLAKGYVSAQSMVGDSIRIPGAEAGQEDWDKFYGKFDNVPGLTRYDPDNLDSLHQAAGRPPTANDYEVDADADFLGVAHAAGLSRQQVEALLEHDETILDESERESNVALEGDIQELRSEWGLAFEDKIGVAQQAVAFLDGITPGLVDALDSSGAGNLPPIIKLFEQLGANLGESDSGFGDSFQAQSGLTPHEAKAQIAEIQNNPQHPYHNGDESALDHFIELHRFAHPE